MVKDKKKEKLRLIRRKIMMYCDVSSLYGCDLSPDVSYTLENAVLSYTFSVLHTLKSVCIFV